MKRFVLAASLSLFAMSPALAATCTATSADGKPLSGAAKTAHMKKCCEDNAKSADGKALFGAAKDSFVKKCTGA